MPRSLSLYAGITLTSLYSARIMPQGRRAGHERRFVASESLFTSRTENALQALLGRFYRIQAFGPLHFTRYAGGTACSRTPSDLWYVRIRSAICSEAPGSPASTAAWYARWSSDSRSALIFAQAGQRPDTRSAQLNSSKHERQRI